MTSSYFGQYMALETQERKTNFRVVEYSHTVFEAPGAVPKKSSQKATEADKLATNHETF
jgi:hypothetical protein